MPALLADRDLSWRPARWSDTATAQLHLSAESRPDDLGPLARLLLPAGGLASSYIEGVTANLLALTGSDPLPRAMFRSASQLWQTVVTSDPADLRHLGPSLTLFEI